MPLNLFAAFGVELEYMIVDRATLRVLPICDRLLTAASRTPGAVPTFEDGSAVPAEVALGPISWSNELVAHVVEFKTTGPAPSLAGVADLFQGTVGLANGLLAAHNAMLLPTAMHPTMDPAHETTLWPHGHRAVYEAFNRIFDCRGHGWANLQAAHLNIPFHGDEEFARLHGAVRALLPIMPALAASSPIVDGRVSGFLDTRMEVYRSNSRAIPSTAGRIVPESVFTVAEYQDRILGRIYDDLGPVDPDGILRDEWVNARGAIARFSRSTIEIRVLDMQECPLADLAVLDAIVGALRRLASGPQDPLRVLDTARLQSILLHTIRDADGALIDDGEYLGALGIDPPGKPLAARQVWQQLTLASPTSYGGPSPPQHPLLTIKNHGPLARRILRATGADASRGAIERVYRELARCLAEGRVFEAFPPG